MTVRKEFDNRVDEINSFFEILNIIELEKPHICAINLKSEEANQKVVLDVNSSKVDTLRSTTYLLLYNLIESTVYNSVISIFDEISDNGLKYFDIVEDVQKYWLNNMYKHDDKKKKETIIETIMNVTIQIFNNTIVLASNKINYGGSLDAKAIFATANSMKINIGNVLKIYDENKHGQTLIEIKQKRNWLAHGEKSFIDVGSTSSFGQLEEVKTNVLDFLREFISAVETYIIKQQYKKTAV
ncbi:MAG: MAE_28990/MAE_18760 family HEPN-like nuclease [Limnohabitans sp.]|nr:MAE_28990/MAE_18760 family HEPN-like nuclease [Limnohabitans sp.]